MFRTIYGLSDGKIDMTFRGALIYAAIFMNSFLKMIHNSMMNLCNLFVLPMYGLFDDLS